MAILLHLFEKMSFDIQIKNGDLVIQNGDLKKITDLDKLLQDILKICLTPAGANPINPWYGSYLNNSIIGSGIDGDIINEIGKGQLSKCLDKLIELQNQQLNSQQSVTADELINNITSITISRSQQDLRLFVVVIKVITKGGKMLPVAFQVPLI